MQKKTERFQDKVAAQPAVLPLPLDLLERVDRWANAQHDRPSREEAVRRLLLMALGQPTTAGETIAPEDLNASNDE